MKVRCINSPDIGIVVGNIYEAYSHPLMKHMFQIYGIGYPKYYFEEVQEENTCPFTYAELVQLDESLSLRIGTLNQVKSFFGSQAGRTAIDEGLDSLIALREKISDMMKHG
jgi:hypothetical protein